MPNRLVQLVNSHWINYSSSSGEKAPLSQSSLADGRPSQGSAATKAANWGTLQNGVKKRQLFFQCSKAFIISISRQMNFWQIPTQLSSIYPVTARVWVLGRCCLSRDCFRISAVYFGIWEVRDIFLRPWNCEVRVGVCIYLYIYKYTCAHAYVFNIFKEVSNFQQKLCNWICVTAYKIITFWGFLIFIVFIKLF